MLLGERRNQLSFGSPTTQGALEAWIRAPIDSLENVKKHESNKVHSCISSLALVALPGKQSDIHILGLFDVT